MSKLAFFGGIPVRSDPFPTNMVGASLIGEEELAELQDVVREKSPFRHYGVGQPGKVDAFERMAREYFGCRYALAVSSGTAALMCAVAAAGIGPGDEVIIPGFSWYSDYSALVNFGVTPVFADIGEDLNLSPEDFERKITTRTKAVIPVHYQGCPAAMDKIMEIANRSNILVIEDCAQALGGSFNGKKLGTIGHSAIFSFQTHKMITAGEGGMFITNDEEMFVRAVRYHDLGFVRQTFAAQLSSPALSAEEHSFAGMQLRMGELNGAFLLAQMRKLDGMLSTCREWHSQLRAHVAGRKEFTVRFVEGDCGIAFILLMDSSETVHRFQSYMAAEGIPCSLASACCNLVHKAPITTKRLVHPSLPPYGQSYTTPQPSLDPAVCTPNTDNILSRCASIGIGPTYTQREISDTIAAMKKIFEELF